MRYLLVAMVALVLVMTVAAVYAQGASCKTGDIASMCSREGGLCGLATRALTKGAVLLGYTRDKGSCPTTLHVHVFKLDNVTERRARVSAYLYSPSKPKAGEKLDLMRHGPGEYKVPITWDTSKSMELAVRVSRRNMPSETVYFNLEPGIAPETK